MEFMNTHMSDEMLAWVMAETEVGEMAARKNTWSRGAWTPAGSELQGITPEGVLRFKVEVTERGKTERLRIETELRLQTGALSTVDDLVLALMKLAGGTGGGGSDRATAKLLLLPGASDGWSLPENLWLNTTPYRRALRDMFYGDVSDAMRASVADRSCSRRMKVTICPPELNMEMDTYRVGSLLEMVRVCALRFAEGGLKTRICVQGSMGQGAFTGVPRVLSGVRQVLSMMDWDSGEGAAHEGVVGDEASEGLVRFGAVGAEEVAPDDDILIILAPQSMVGASIYEPLSEMVERATGQGASVILINSLLQDRPSSGGLMSVRGRSERIAFAESFEEIYHFRLVYSGTTFMFPILGALRMTQAGRLIGGCEVGEGGDERGAGDQLAKRSLQDKQPPMYVLYQRREDGKGNDEEYGAVAAYLGREPTPEEITRLVPSQVEPLPDATT
jgi:adenylate kinase